jgi:hypothetical protein
MATSEVKSTINELHYSSLKNSNGLLKKENLSLGWLFIIACIWQVSNTTLYYNNETFVSSGLIMGFLFLILVNWPMLYIYAYVFNFIAKKFGGIGEVKSTFNALLHSLKPGIIAITLYFVVLFIFGEGAIKKTNAASYLANIRIGLIAINYLLFAWSLFLFMKEIKTIHQITLRKAMLVVALPFLTINSIFLLLYTIF